MAQKPVQRSRGVPSSIKNKTSLPNHQDFNRKTNPPDEEYQG